MKKITSKELKKVTAQQQELNEVLTNIGVLETQKHGLLHKIAELNKDINEVKKELEDKYGQININLEDGTYTEVEKE